MGSDHRDRDETNLWTIAVSCFEITVPVVAELKLHVGLARAHPDFTDEDVLNNSRGRSFDRDGPRGGVRWQGGQLNRPFAIGSSDGCLLIAGKGDRDFSARRIPAPQRIGLLLLQHHVIAYNSGEFKFRP
ncbi:MAG: hypothetical protein EBT89_06075 [Opitutaceae bacterium]|nr:hypothetical protein [Opitutaceae bacterium]